MNPSAINSIAPSMFTTAVLAHMAIVLIVGLALLTLFWYKFHVFNAVSRSFVPDEMADWFLMGGPVAIGAGIIYILSLFIIYASTIIYGYLLWQFEDTRKQSILNWSAVYILEFIAFFTSTGVAMFSYRLIVRFGERRYMREVDVEMELPSVDRSYFGLPEKGSINPPPRYGEDAPPPYTVEETTV